MMTHVLPFKLLVFIFYLLRPCYSITIFIPESKQEKKMICVKNGLDNGPLRVVIQASDGGIVKHLQEKSGIEKVI